MDDTLYSDMADVMIHRDNPIVAVSFEVLWNEMARHHAFTLEHNRVNTTRRES